jgi:hypothetical protein
MPTKVDVTVTYLAPSTPPGKTAISISADPDPIELQGIGHGAGADIHWDITTPGWKFVTNGVEIHNHSGKFTDKHGSAGGQRHTWQRNVRDTDPTSNKYKYTIIVTDQKTTVSWDPWIINN